MKKRSESKNFFSKENLLLIGGFLVLQVILLFVAVPTILYFFLHSESHFDPDPEIDTAFTENFSKENFERVRLGMSTKEIQDLLGEPFQNDEMYDNALVNKNTITLQVKEGVRCWTYSTDGKLGAKADFSWYSYKVCFEDGKVSEKPVVEYFD